MKERSNKVFTVNFAGGKAWFLSSASWRSEEFAAENLDSAASLDKRDYRYLKSFVAERMNITNRY